MDRQAGPYRELYPGDLELHRLRSSLLSVLCKRLRGALGGDRGGDRRPNGAALGAPGPGRQHILAHAAGRRDAEPQGLVDAAARGDCCRAWRSGAASWPSVRTMAPLRLPAGVPLPAQGRHGSGDEPDRVRRGLHRDERGHEEACFGGEHHQHLGCRRQGRAGVDVAVEPRGGAHRGPHRPRPPRPVGVLRHPHRLGRWRLDARRRLVRLNGAKQEGNGRLVAGLWQVALRLMSRL
mmetsp:Transcript_172699/g.553515  ORF Transcript_172699/g.553515 Transcript_172699/m.553515 type:complete len:236 (-) Transcript_172699:51-758(-)